MQDIIEIKGTADSPNIKIDKASKIMKIGGYSYPEDPQEVYEPVNKWFDAIEKEDFEDSVDIEFYFSVLNSSSNKVVYDMIHRLDNYYKAGKTINIKWYYDEDDEDMMFCGEDIMELVKVPIDVIATDPEEMLDFI